MDITDSYSLPYLHNYIFYIYILYIFLHFYILYILYFIILYSAFDLKCYVTAS